jgi:hypothetical protein
VAGAPEVEGQTSGSLRARSDQACDQNGSDGARCERASVRAHPEEESLTNRAIRALSAAAGRVERKEATPAARIAAKASETSVSRRESFTREVVGRHPPSLESHRAELPC